MKPLYGQIIKKDMVKKEKSAGLRMSEVTLGETLLIHSYFFRTQYIAYQDISRLFMRVAGGEFGEFPLDEYSLVIVDKTGQEHVLHVERGEYIKSVQEWVKANHPEIMIGKK